MTDSLREHAALRHLAQRVRLRRLLRMIRRGLLAAVLGTAAINVAGRTLSREEWPVVALVWCALCLLVAVALGLGAPDEWTIAREADRLGLAERVTSSLHARMSGSAVADLIERDARAALSGLDPDRYAVGEGARAWAALGVAGAVLVVLLAIPLPTFGAHRDSADAQRVATAQQRVEALQLQLQSPADGARQTSDLDTHTRAQLQTLRDALARSTTSAEAARTIEQAQEQLSRLPGADDYSARRSVDAMAAALESQQDDALIPLARALRAHDEQAVQQALANLSDRLDRPGTTDVQRASAQLGLQAAANAASNAQPQLAGTLRRAASGVGSHQKGALADTDLQDQLAQSVTAASALDRVEQTTANLGQVRAATLPAGATLVPASGTPTAFALAQGTPPPNATPIALGVTQAGNNASRGGGDSGQNGVGSGAAPDGTTTYDPVYAPTHLGGEPGPQVQVGGDATDARGDNVDLPQGPVTAGDVRPYDQVYSQYAQEARQSVARQSLPPNVQGLVDRYFGAIAPTPGATTP
jgi:hypothetical protein